MPHSKDELIATSTKNLITIARELKIVGRDRMKKIDLIDAILTTEQPTTEVTEQPTTEATEQPTTEATEQPTTETPPIKFDTYPTPEEFFSLVKVLDNKLAVHQACNALLDKMSETLAVSTISKKLTAYKKPFYAFKHSNPELNETVDITSGKNTQHIAAKLLTLSDEQIKELKAKREVSANARAGFDADGDIREVEKAVIDIAAVIETSLKYLNSTDPHIIGAGILNLTGLRVNEQNMPFRKYDKWDEIIERDMIVVDEFVIGFKGISKKPNLEDAQSYYARITLAPAQMIVDAQKKFLSSKAVKAIPTDYEKYRTGFMDTFSNRYSDLFGTVLSTIEAYDDDENLINANGTPHKGRAFYACALRAILKAKNFNSATSSKYIQQCLAHENEGITIKYLGRYDESEFINPTDVNIPTNINKVGKLTAKTIKTLTTESTMNTKTPAKSNVNSTDKKDVKAQTTFDVDAFIGALNPELQTKFGELLNTESSLTNAVIAVIKGMQNQNMVTTSNFAPYKKPSVTDEINMIVKKVMQYNNEQTLETNRIVPTYSLINKISERLMSKTIAKTTVDTWLGNNGDNLKVELEALGIPGGIYNTLWNGKHHRKTMDTVIDAIVTLINSKTNNGG